MVHTAVLSRDTIPSSQLSPFLCKQTEPSQLCKELDRKSSMHNNFFPQVNSDTITCPWHTSHTCVSAHRVSVGTGLVFLLFQQQSRAKAIIQSFMLLISVFTRTNYPGGNELTPKKHKRELSNWSTYKHCHESTANTLVLLKCKSM